MASYDTDKDSKKKSIDTEDAEYGGGKDKADQQRHWMNQISSAKKEIEPWHDRGQKICDIYLDKRGQRNKRRKFNLFTANTNNLLSSLFGRIPKPDIARRFKDPNDHAGRVASNILQRGIEGELANDGYFTSTAKNIIKDKLIPGAGFAWVRYTNDVSKANNDDDDQPISITDNVDDEAAEVDDSTPIISNERTPVEHVNWKDFLYSPARTWNEVTWVARRAYLDKNEFSERFPKHKELVEHETLDDMIKARDDEDMVKESEVEVWEIWCKNNKQVYFFTEGASEILECKDDPYGLPHFFPCPKPLFANVNTSKLMPTPDYAMVQDQYEQLNELNERRSSLISACKVAGSYDAEYPELKDIFEGPENRLVPIKDWANFAGDKGGLRGVIQFVDINQISVVIQQIDMAMNNIKQQIEELTGISDIIRGSTSAYETLGAQQMKGQYASMRFNSQQTEVAEFFSELLNIKAFLMAKFYDEKTLLRQAGMMPTEYSPPHADMMYFEAALALLKDELLTNINVLVSVDSLSAGNDATVMQQKNEVMTSLAGLIAQAFPVIQAMPDSKEMFLHLIKAQVAGMPGAKDLEGVIDQQLTRLLMPQEPEGPDPAQAAQQAQIEQAQQAQMMAAQEKQAEMQQAAALEQAKMEQAMQIETTKGQAAIQMKQMEIDRDMQIAQMKTQYETDLQTAKLQMEAQKIALDEKKSVIDERKMVIEEQKAVHELGGFADTTSFEGGSGDATKVTSRDMMMQFMQQSQEQMMMFMAAQQEQMASTLAALAIPEEPLQIVVQRDANGRMTGATEI